MKLPEPGHFSVEVLKIKSLKILDFISFCICFVFTEVGPCHLKVYISVRYSQYPSNVHKICSDNDFGVLFSSLTLPQLHQFNTLKNANFWLFFLYVCFRGSPPPHPHIIIVVISCLIMFCSHIFPSIFLQLWVFHSHVRRMFRLSVLCLLLSHMHLR